ncbi:hypothetical protein [Xanthomonas arboricola]|uniref:hypothetical protein n=1 Tax=Xanthomonas arboricola TaxID=56448 RepID=UPI001CA54990|nr:hypothetical protein [Xanthomonas arboricola]
MVHPRFEKFAKVARSPTPLVNGTEPPDDGAMDDRLTKLEALVPTLATKADVEKASHDVTKWLVGTMVGGIGLFIVIMTFVLNNAIPKATAPPPQQAAPIVIQLPAQPPAANPSPSKP